jgi:hypothetical protein
MGEAKWSGGRLVTGVDLRRALSRQVQRVVTEMEMDDNVSDGKGWPDGEEGGNAQTGPRRRHLQPSGTGCGYRPGGPSDQGMHVT